MVVGESGPYVQVAAFCQLFITGKESGNLSIINIVDGVTVGGTDPDNMPGFSLMPFPLVVTLWAGETKGRFGLKLVPEEPSGLTGDDILLPPVNFPAHGPRGVNVIHRLDYEVTEEGTYWFSLVLSATSDAEGQLLTRLPLNVQYQPQIS